MKSLAAPVLSALAGSSLVTVQLVRLAFPSGDVLLNTSTWDLDWDGLTYRGAYGLGSIAPVRDQPGEAQRLTLTLNGGDATRLALALDAADEVQGATVYLRTAMVSTSTYQILDAVVDWVGRCDTMSITEDGRVATISVSVESADIDLLRGNASTYSQADQDARFSGDLAFQYQVSQLDQAIIWPAREFFFK